MIFYNLSYMNNPGIRIPIISVGFLLLLFKDTILANQTIVIPAEYTITDWMIAVASIVLVIIGAVGFRKKSIKNEIQGLNDTVKHLEEEISELTNDNNEHKPIT
jgi:hypothetical protein